MAARRRARKAHKRNPIKTTGALVINPKRSKSRKGRKHTITGKIRAHTRRVKNPVPAFLRRIAIRRPIAARRIAVARRPVGVRRVALRRFLSHHPRVAARVRALRSNRKHSRKHVRRRKNGLALVQNRRRRSRKNGLALVQNRKRRSHKRRRNPGMIAGTIGTAQKYAGKIPFIGGLIASALGYIVPVVLGAIGVEPTMQLAKFVGPMVPGVNASMFYLGASLISAALAKFLLPKTGFVSQEMATKIALAIASGGGAVAYYKFRTGDDKDMAGEVGALELSGGFAEAVAPLGMFGDAFGDDMGAIEVISGMYSDSTPQDIVEGGHDMDYGEIEAALSGPKKWKHRFGKPRKGQSKGSQAGHRHGWLVHVVGFENVQKIAALPSDQRKSVIANIKQSALQAAQQQLSAGGPLVPTAEAQEMGALSYAY